MSTPIDRIKMCRQIEERISITSDTRHLPMLGPAGVLTEFRDFIDAR
ncbi:MAG: hypothetical protein U0R18_14660 [Mycobacterium sp.]